MTSIEKKAKMIGMDLGLLSVKPIKDGEPAGDFIEISYKGNWELVERGSGDKVMESSLKVLKCRADFYDTADVAEVLEEALHTAEAENAGADEIKKKREAFYKASADNQSAYVRLMEAVKERDTAYRSSTR